MVTGATAGVGRAIVEEFARHGARIALLARGEERLEATRRSALGHGATDARSYALDVAEAAQVEEAAERVEAELGPIEVWVNCAMATVFAPVRETAAEDFRRANDVTYLGYVWGTMAALRRMRPRNRGTIVQVGSALAYRSIPLQAAYCGAKAAIRGFTDSLRTELLHEGSDVHVTMVQLPGLNTPQFGWGRTTLPRHPRPVAPVFQPELAGRAVWKAAHQRRREVWVAGSTVLAILSARLAPGIGDRFLARSAVDGQQLPLPIEPGRIDNLFSPPPGDPGAHGMFDDEAHASSVQATLDLNRRAVAATAVATASAAWALAARVGRRR